jgi:CBS domain-containing protein
MKIKDIMSEQPHWLSPTDTLQKAAELMRDLNIGSLPVGENDRLIGVINDRDIAIRAVSEGLPSDTPVRDIMTTKVFWCFEEDDILLASKKMTAEHVRRLIVLNKDKRLVGLVSISDFASKSKNDELCGKIERDLASKWAA